MPQKKADALRVAVEGYNEAVAERWGGEVESSRAEYNGALDGARAFVEEVRDGRRGEYDDKSERWQEGERGEAAAAWLAEWEQPNLEDLELDPPEPVDEPDLDHADTLWNGAGPRSPRPQGSTGDLRRPLAADGPARRRRVLRMR